MDIKLTERGKQEPKRPTFGDVKCDRFFLSPSGNLCMKVPLGSMRAPGANTIRVDGPEEGGPVCCTMPDDAPVTLLTNVEVLYDKVPGKDEG